MNEHLNETYKEWLMKDVNKKRKKEGLESITFEQHINNVTELLKRSAERYKEAGKDFDWSKVENTSVLCGNHSTWDYDCSNLYVFDRKSGKYIKGGK